MVLFQDKTQFLLLPTFGFIRDQEGLFFTVAFMYYGVSFRVGRFTQE